MDEYSTPFTSDKEKIKFSETLDEYEKSLKSSAKLTLEQLNWRRWAIQKPNRWRHREVQTGVPSNDRGSIRRIKQVSHPEAVHRGPRQVHPKPDKKARRHPDLRGTESETLLQLGCRPERRDRTRRLNDHDYRQDDRQRGGIVHRTDTAGLCLLRKSNRRPNSSTMHSQ